LHLVEVTAVLELETPTGPLTLESVHVSPVPSARTEKPAAAPSPPAACAATGHAPARTANEISSRNRNLKTTRLILDLLRPIRTKPAVLAVNPAYASPLVM
jgi:hypothetical protein